eukprot:gene28458-34355_t
MDEALEGWKESQGPYLNLSGCTISPDFFKFFQNNQSICANITGLDMDGCSFVGDEALSMVTQSLSYLPALETLSFRRTDFMACEGARELIHAICRRGGIGRLDLGITHLGERDLELVTETVRSSTSIRMLYLDNNNLDQSCVAALCNMLRSNSSITFLDLCKNPLGNKGVKTLSQALKDNKALMTLNLDSNDIGDDAAGSLAQAVQSHPALTCLNLRANKICGHGAADLADMLEKNGKIVEMDLRWNYIEGDYMSKIDTYIQRNKRGTHSISISASTSIDDYASSSNPETTVRPESSGAKKRTVMASPDPIPLLPSFDTSIFNLSFAPAVASYPSFQVSADVLKDARALSILSVGNSFHGNLQHNASKSTDRLHSSDSEGNPNRTASDVDEYGEDFNPEHSESSPSRPVSKAREVRPQRPPTEVPSHTSSSPLQMRRNLSLSTLSKDSSAMETSVSSGTGHRSHLPELQREHHRSVQMSVSAEQHLKGLETSIDQQTNLIDQMKTKLPRVKATEEKLAELLNTN